MSVTEEDQAKAWQVLCALPISIPGYSPETVRKAQDHLAAALADEREKARAPFLALIPELEQGAGPGEGEYLSGVDSGMERAAEMIRQAAQDQP